MEVEMMFCKNCGQTMEEGRKFCPNCGAPVDAPAEPSGAPVYAERYEPAMSSTPVLVWGIIGLAFSCSFYFSFLGIIFSAIGLSKAKAFFAANGQLFGKAKVGKILATVGLIVSIVMTGLAVLLIAVIGAAAVSGLGSL